MSLKDAAWTTPAPMLSCCRLAEYLDSGSAARERLTPSVAQQPSQAGSTQSSSSELPLRDIIREEVRAALLVPQASQPTHLSASSPAGVAATIPLDTADCLPPSGKKTFHAFIPKYLHDKIVSGQFVEFGLLLQSSNQTDPSRTFLQMNQGKDGGNSSLPTPAGPPEGLRTSTRGSKPGRTLAPSMPWLIRPEPMNYSHTSTSFQSGPQIPFLGGL